MKKIIYIAGILSALGVIGYLGWMFLRETPQENIGNGISAPQQGLLPSAPANSPSITSITDQFPKTPTVKLGTSQGIVEVKNFYNALVDTEEGSVILKNLDDYVVAYRRDTSIFTIELFSNSQAVRQAAETELLNILGIGQTDACKLNVTVSVPYSPGNPLNAKSSMLSFCFK
ncbi:MAG: hypothetical protein HY433_00880 [Candidatus Liptonbacteria bacterium]|nr:hypothetical protein [Candidatus Liptonbacteria bacterium]